MTWFYVIDGQKNGPISDPQLDELLHSGKISSETLVWREGMADWQPLGVVRTVGASVAGQPANLICVECGRTFPPSELIRINQSSVCAACKPIFLQRLSEGAAVPSSVHIWRKNKRVVTVTNAVFPDRCIKCNEPANGYRLKRNLSWHHPAYYAFILCNLLIYVIIALVVRKRAVVYIGLCGKHRAQRKWALIATSLGMIGGIILIFVGAGFQSGATAVIGAVLFLAGLIAGIGWGRTVAAANITKENVWVSGVNRKFLEELPEWPGV